jgi:hypothetical protein
LLLSEIGAVLHIQDHLHGFEALAIAAKFLSLRNEYEAGLDFPDITAMYRAYEAELFRFDQMYRHFCENADVATAQGWDLLKPLREDIEACYCNWYLTNIALAWGKFMDAELPEKWAIEGVPNQYNFFEHQIRPWLDEADKRRAFVIISDAMRFEVAQELTQQLNGTYPSAGAIVVALGGPPLLYGPGNGEPPAPPET